jgi:glycine C-acetyltransferase/8-amino-7-oxononanoate synthase
MLNGKELRNFSSNDYLGLASEPEVLEGAIEAVRKFGAGSGASRLISGSLAIHQRLENELAEFKGCEAALVFSSGYAAAQAALTSLLSKHDVVIMDKLIHASLVDAAGLCRATLRVFAHNDLEDLEAKLKWARERKVSAPGQGPQKVLVVTESIFSMEGDASPLAEIVRLKDEYGAWLMVDEAHATGLYGANLKGMVDHHGLSSNVEIQMGTLGKALGASGGYLCGSRTFVELLVNRARQFIFSTAPVPAASGAALAALRFIRAAKGKERAARLWKNVKQFTSAMDLPSKTPASAIFPVLVGSSEKAMAAFETLLEKGFFVPAIRYPSVPRNKARLRITLSAVHSAEDLGPLTTALNGLE